MPESDHPTQPDGGPPPDSEGNAGQGPPHTASGASPRSDDTRTDVFPRDGERMSLKDVVKEEPPPRLEQGSDKYDVIESLGKGGMGEVFLVFDRDLKRRVALKMCRNTDGTRGVRFVEEAQIMGQLQHPNVLPVYELGLAEGRWPFYTMPEVRGTTLEKILSGLREGDGAVTRTYSLTRLIQVFLQLTQAMAYVHERGVIHRDLKPSNIMLGEHGEVLLLDWGVSKVVAKGHIETDSKSPITQAGHVVGTPAYMSPEHALQENLDARSDLYSLGVILYEILALQPPFGGSQAEILASVMRDEPAAPRARNPRREIPIELERICLKAMRKDPAGRHQSAQELHDEIQAWFEAETDRARRHERAEEAAIEGRRKLALYGDLKRQVRELSDDAARLRKRLKGWQPVAEKRPLLDTERALDAARIRMIETASEVVMTLAGALGFESGNKTARAGLADYYWERFQESEERLDVEGLAFFGKLVASYDDGRYVRKLQGDGALALGSTPEGAEAWLTRLVEEDFSLVAKEEMLLGKTPLGDVALPMGRYVVVLRHDGHRDVRCPVFISRNRRWIADVRLFAEDDIGPEFVLVPAGPFIAGGDPEIADWCVPRQEVELPDFFMSVHPVTNAQYLEFLNDLAAGDPERARLHAPRQTPDGPVFLENVGGRLAFPARSPEGHPWGDRQPVVAISKTDADAYCEWRSARDGRQYRLPTEMEWEKAARGVDGRFFPWGFRFDPCLCNMKDSRREGAALVDVDEYPLDASVYGVRGLAGNAADWTRTEVHEDESGAARPVLAVRGGAWLFSSITSRCAYRLFLEPLFVSTRIGFRLVHVPRDIG